MPASLSGRSTVTLPIAESLVGECLGVFRLVKGQEDNADELASLVLDPNWW